MRKCTGIRKYFIKNRLRKYSASHPLGSQPAQKNKSSKDKPVVGIPVGSNREVATDHDQDQRHRNIGIVFGTSLRPYGQGHVRWFIIFHRSNHFSLGRQNGHPDIGCHNSTKDSPNMHHGRP